MTHSDPQTVCKQFGGLLHPLPAFRLWVIVGHRKTIAHNDSRLTGCNLVLTGCNLVLTADRRVHGSQLPTVVSLV